MPRALYKLLSNSVYIVTCLGACMELVIVSGFCVFLPKYLETQFDVSKADANVLIGEWTSNHSLGSTFDIKAGWFVCQVASQCPVLALAFWSVVGCWRNWSCNPLEPFDCSLHATWSVWPCFQPSLSSDAITLRLPELLQIITGIYYISWWISIFHPFEKLKSEYISEYQNII